MRDGVSQPFSLLFLALSQQTLHSRSEMFQKIGFDSITFHIHIPFLFVSEFYLVVLKVSRFCARTGTGKPGNQTSQASPYKQFSSKTTLGDGGRGQWDSNECQ